MFKRSIFKFEFKVIVLMLVILVIVVATGVSAYFRFSTLLANISNSVRPDNRLVLSHLLENDLTELANIVKTHSLTEDESYYKNYAKIKQRIEKRLIEFKQQTAGEINNLDVDVLDTLIRDRLIVLDGIMYSEDPFRVQTALGKVVVNLGTDSKNERSVSEKNTSESTSSTTSSVKGVVDFDLLKESNDKLQSIEKEEGKLLKKLKKAEKKNKTDKVEELDSLLNARKAEAINIQKKLTKHDEYERDKAIAINQIYKEIEDVSTEELLIEKEIKSAQLEFLSMDNLLSLKIAGFFDEFELIENAKIAEATAYAELENEKTNRYVVLFSIFIAIMMFLMVFIIIQYVKKNNLYKTALKRSTQETERLVKTRERLMVTISHEIRTPMHAISGFAEQLSKEKLSENQKDYVSMIQKSSEHLTYLINDVLDLSKLQNGKLKLNKKPFDIHGLLNDAVLFSKQLLREKQVEIELKIQPDVLNYYVGDIYRLRQILLNLMGNAVKFTEKGFVRLSVSKIAVQNNEKETLKIIIEDTGVGMTEKQLKRAFNEFEQFDTTATNKISGTGLGLPIAKKLVELHDGTIKIESEQEKGTTVEVLLNLAVSERTQEEVEVKEKTKQIVCTSILIVDDEEYNRKLLKAMLNPYNVQLYEAENGKEALHQLKQNSVDLVLLDARMPIMDGRKTIEEIRLLKNGKQIKVILLTAAGNDIDDVLEQVNGYISKPFSEESLIAEINRVFKKSNGIMEQRMNEFDKNSIDFANLKSLSGTDTAFYEDMLNTFSATTKGSFKTMKIAFANDDWELLANEAHKISSPCRHIGALELHGILKEIESSARETKKTIQLKNKMKELEEEISVVLKEVDNELATIH